MWNSRFPQFDHHGITITPCHLVSWTWFSDLLPSLPGWTNVTEEELAFAPDLTEAGARSLQLLLCSSARNESAVSEWHAHTVSRKRWCGETHEGRWKIDVNIRCHVTAHRIYTVWPGFVRITVGINGVSRSHWI